MSRNRLSGVALILATAAMLSACGGGGGDPGIPAGNFDVQTGYANYLTGTRSFDLNGSANNVDYTVAIDMAPAPAAAFQPTGAIGNRLNVDVTISAAGQLLASGTTTYYFNVATLAMIGVQQSVGVDVTCATVTSNTIVPTSVQVGASGALLSANLLSSCQPGAPATGVVDSATWSLESDAGFALLCINSGTPPSGSESDCIEISGSGTLGTHARVTIDFPGMPQLVAKNY